MSDGATSGRDLRTDSEHYRAIFEATSDGLVINDPETGLVLEANPAFCRMHGYEHMAGMHPGEFTHPDTRYLFEDYARVAAAGGQLRWRCRHIRRDGTCFDVEVTGRGFTYRGKPALLGVVRDVTDRVREEQLMEERVEVRTRELRTLLEVSNQIAGTLELKDILAMVVDRLPSVIDCVGSGIAVLDDDSLVLVASRSGQAGKPIADVRIPLSQIQEVWEVISKGGDVIVDDVCDSGQSPQCYPWVSWDFSGHQAYQGTRAWMAVPLQHKDRVIGLLNLSSDRESFYTQEHARLARVLAGQVAAAIESARLYESAAGRTRELSTLLDVSRSVAATLDLEALLRIILEQVRVVADYDRASFGVLEGDTLEIRSSTWVSEQREGLPEGARVDVSAAPDIWRLARSGEPIIIPDVSDDSPIARQYRQARVAVAERTRSWMGVPLLSRGQIMGLLSLSKSVPGFFTAQQARLARAFADQAAVAIENARLYEHAEERKRELATLLNVTRNVASTLDLEELLRVILEQVRVVAEYDSSSFSLLEGDTLVVHSVDWPQREGGKSTVPRTRAEGTRIQVARAPKLWDLLKSADPVIIDDVKGDSELARQYWEAAGPDSRRVRSWLGVPMMSRDKIIGLLSLCKFSPGFFTGQHARLARAIADQATIAIENARLYEQAQQLAAADERQRLARELHDSVSQAIYGISLGARTARTLQDLNPSDAIEPMEYVISLAEGALAEMRALIFELRPQSLANEGLVAAITRRVEVTAVRYGIAVDWDPPDEPEAPLPVKEAAYRIVQEALHNIVKHSRATRAGVTLKDDQNALSFRVVDNGVGFDPGRPFSGHFGLKSMRERLEGLGGVLKVESRPNSGATITGSIPFS